MTAAVRFALVGVLLLAAAMTAWSVGSEPSDWAQNRERIASMTEAERDRLRRRYEAFRELPESQRAIIRQLHTEVQADDALRQTLEEFHTFYSRLEPWEQEELRQANASERIARLERLVAERTRTPGPARGSWLAGWFAPGTVFPPSQFDQAVMRLADALQLTAQQRRELEALEPHRRHLRIIQQAATHWRQGRPSAPWPDDETVEEITSLLPAGWLRDWLFRDEQTTASRRLALPSLLARSLHAEWQRIVLRAIPRQEFEAALEQIPERQQSEWVRRDPDRLAREVIEVLASGEGPTADLATDYAEVLRLRSDFDPFFGGRRRPPFGRPPFDAERRGGPGDRRPDRGRDGPGRPPEDFGRRGGFGPPSGALGGPPNGPPPLRPFEP